MDKKKIFAILLFVIMGFFMFTFANPGNGITEVEEPTPEPVVDTPTETPSEPVVETPTEPTVVDQAPTMTINPATMYVVATKAYDVTKGVTVSDDLDTVTLEALDTDYSNIAVGTYTINFRSTTDRSGQRATGSRQLIVLDPDADLDGDHYTNGEEDAAGTDVNDSNDTPDYDYAPIINLDAFVSSMIVYDELPDFESMADATDEYYGKKGVTLTVSHNVNANQNGVYQVIFTATDILNNKTVVSKDFTVNKRPLEVTIDDISSIYLDSINTLTYSAPLELTAYSAGIKLETSATSSSDIGFYPITGTYTDTNYDVTFVAGQYEIIARPLNEREFNLAFTDAKITYDAKTHHIDVTNVPTDLEVSYENNDQIVVGEYEVTATITPKADSNYSGTITLTAQLTINKAPIVVAIEDKTSLENNELATLTFVNTTPLKGSDTLLDLKVNLNTTADITVPGTYPITGTSSSDNYNVTFTNGTYTIKADKNDNDIDDDLESFTLTINYVYSNTDLGLAATQYTATIKHNATYSVTSPTVEYYVADKLTISGTMDLADITETVTYSPINDENDNDIADETEDHFDIIYNDYDGTNLGTFEDVLVDMPTPTIANPTRTDYLFAGWNPSVEATVTANATYVATYDEDFNHNDIPDKNESFTLTINYVYSNADLGLAAAQYTATIKHNATYSVTSPTVEYYVADKLTISGTMDLADITETVTYSPINDENDNDIADETEDHFDIIYNDYDGTNLGTFEDVLVDMPTPTIANPTRTDYLFAGWNPSVEATVTANATYVATYDEDFNHNDIPDKNESFTLTINYVYSNTDLGLAATQYTATVKHNATYSVTSPTVEYYVADKLTISGTMDLADITETVTYSPINDENDNDIADETEDHFDIIYNDYDGTNLGTFEDILVDMPTPTIANPTRDGYTFAGWNPSVEATVTENVTYVATYDEDFNHNDIPDKNESFTLTINYVYSNADLGLAAAQYTATIKHNATYSVTSPTVEYYVADKLTISGTMDLADITETVTYSPINDENDNDIADETEDHFDIIYNDYDGTNLGTFEDILVDMPTPTINNPTRDGYTFAGWNPSVEATVTENVTYVATYTANTNTAYTVITKIQALDGTYATTTNTLSGTTDSTITLEPEALEGYSIATSSTLFGVITADGNLVLTIIYDLNTYTITYYSDETVLGSKDYLYGDSVTYAVADPSKTNYTFTGWDASVTTMPAHDVDIHAVYEANLISIRLELAANKQLVFELNSTDNVKDRLKVIKVYADGTEVEATQSEYTVNNFDVTYVGTRALSVTLNDLVSNTLNYKIQIEAAYDTKFEVQYPSGVYTYDTKELVCDNRGRCHETTGTETVTYRFIKIIEHYDEVISLSKVTALYSDGVTRTLYYSDSVYYSYYKNEAGHNYFYDPVRIGSLGTNGGEDVMTDDLTIRQINITYYRTGYGNFTITFAYNATTNTFTAISEVNE